MVAGANLYFYKPAKGLALTTGYRKSPAVLEIVSFEGTTFFKFIKFSRTFYSPIAAPTSSTLKLLTYKL